MEWIRHPRVLRDAQEHSLSFPSPPPTGRWSPAEAPPGVPGHAPPPPRKGPAPHPKPGEGGAQSQEGGGGRSEILAFISRPASKRVGAGVSRRVLLLWGRLQVLTESARELGVSLREPRVRLPAPAPEVAGVLARGPVAALTLSGTSRGAALLPTDVLSKRLPGYPRPLSLLPRRITGLPTSTLQASSFGMQWIWAGPCPPNFSSSAFSLEDRGCRKEEENESGAAQGGGHQGPDIDLRRHAAGVRTAGVQGARHRRGPADPLQGQALRERRLEAVPGGGGVGSRPIALLLAPSPLPHALCPSHPSFTARARPTSGGKLSCRSTSSSLARASFSAGGRGVMGGARSPRGLGPAPSAPKLQGASHLQ